MTNDRTMNALDSGQVVRFHAVPSIRDKQEVSAHSWGVAVIALELAKLEGLDTRGQLDLQTAALLHDCAELYTGDIPFPVKRDERAKALFNTLELECAGKLPGIPFLGPRCSTLLKLADMLEGLRYAYLNEDSDKLIHGRWREALNQFIDASGGKVHATVLAYTEIFMERFGCDTGEEATSAYVDQ